MNTDSGGQVQPASGWHNAGQVVTVKAKADHGFHFVSWTGTGLGSYTGSDNPASFTMLAPITEEASFTHN
jgi:hypothetical protein